MNALSLRRSIGGNLPHDSTGIMSQISHRLARLRIANTRPGTEHSWENPEASIGDFCRTMGKSQCWHAQVPARELFILLAAEIKTYMDRNCESPSRELHWSLYMIGQTKSTARPVLMFICEDSNSRKTARKTIKESGILLRYPGVDTADCSHPPDFGQLVQLAAGDMDDFFSDNCSDTEDSYYPGIIRSEPRHHRVRPKNHNRAVSSYHSRSGASTHQASLKNLNSAVSSHPSRSGPPTHQPVIDEYTDGMVIKPANSEMSVFYRPTYNIMGSHIFVKEPNRTDSMSRKATAGVIVRVGEEICFLTAAHGFASRPQSADPCPPFEYDIDGESDSDGEEFLRTIRQGSRSPLSKHFDSALEESENSISRSSSSQEPELEIGKTVTERWVTDR